MPKKSLVWSCYIAAVLKEGQTDMMFSYSILLEWVELSRQVSRYEVTEIVHLTVALKSVKEAALVF